jgi:hypothetical protein
MTANVSFHGTIGGVQVGDNNTQSVVQNNGPELITVEQVIDKIAESIPDELTKSELMPQIRAFIGKPAEEQKKDEPMMQSLLAKVTPYAPQIATSLAVFGDAALTALGATNPLIAGLIAICKRVAKG